MAIRTRVTSAVAAAGALALLAACGSGSAPPPAGSATAPVAAATTAPPTLVQAAPAPLRAGERLESIRMAAPYTPAPPSGGTDDYRCFVIDPKLTEDSYLTGSDFLPQNATVVHHAIFFRIGPELRQKAFEKDAATPGQGWTCFGGDDVNEDQSQTINQAPWVGAWAPGGREGIIPAGYGRVLEKGSLIVMQVHYNLLNVQPGMRLTDQSSMRLRLVPMSSTKVEPLRTLLLTAPVELPCPAGQAGLLCSRDNSILDVQRRFGNNAGRVVNGLQLLCGSPAGVRPGPTQTCLRDVVKPGVVHGIAGHMHLLGRTISVELNPGTPGARMLYDNRNYNFDDQNMVWLKKPAVVRPGDKLKITCTHDAGLRTQLPELRRLKPRYVVWGEGTSDEMCLGVVALSDS
jgi:hypothetical protein